MSLVAWTLTGCLLLTISDARTMPWWGKQADSADQSAREDVAKSASNEGHLTNTDAKLPGAHAGHGRHLMEETVITKDYFSLKVYPEELSNTTMERPRTTPSPALVKVPDDSEGGRTLAGAGKHQIVPIEMEVMPDDVDIPYERPHTTPAPALVQDPSKVEGNIKGRRLEDEPESVEG